MSLLVLSHEQGIHCKSYWSTISPHHPTWKECSSCKDAQGWSWKQASQGLKESPAFSAPLSLILLSSSDLRLRAGPCYRCCTLCSLEMPWRSLMSPWGWACRVDQGMSQQMGCPCCWSRSWSLMNAEQNEEGISQMHYKTKRSLEIERERPSPFQWLAKE